MPPKKNPFDKIREASKQTSRWYSQGSAGSAFAAYSVKNAAFEQRMKGPPVLSEAVESDGKAKPKKRAAAKKSAKTKKDEDEDDFVDDEPVKAPKVKNIFKKHYAPADSDGPEKKLKKKEKTVDEPVKEGKLKKIAKKGEQAVGGAEPEGEVKEKSARKGDSALKRKAHLAPKPSAIMTPEPSELNDLFESPGLPEPFSAFQPDVDGTVLQAVPGQVEGDEEQIAKMPTPIQEDDSDQEGIEPLKTAKQPQPARQPIDKKNAKQPKPASTDENAGGETVKDDKQRKSSHTSKEDSRVTSNQRKRSRVSSMIDQDSSDGDDESSEPQRARVLPKNQEQGQVSAHRKVPQTKAGACDDEEQQSKPIAEATDPTQVHDTDDDDEIPTQRRRTRPKRVIDDDEDEDEDDEITAPFWQPYGGSSNLDYAPSCFLGLGRIPERKIEFFSEAFRDLVKEYGTDREISTDERAYFEDGEEVRDVSVRIDTADSAKIMKRDIDGKLVLGKRLQIRFAEA